MKIWAVTKKEFVKCSNERSGAWNNDETLYVKSHSIEDAIKKTRRHAMKQTDSFWADGVFVRTRVLKVDIYAVKEELEVDIK